MPTICGVRFRGTGKVYYFDPRDLNLETDDYVIVNTSRGDELAQVALPNREVDPSEVVGELKPVLRRASSLDLLEAERYRLKEQEAVERCQEQVEASGLPMKIVSAEYSYDGSRLTFFFTAEKRVDFRNLVRELAHTFKARIELRQIGVRDEAKLVGGLGPCGRPLCCATWLTQFSPVSIRMAKQQNLPLSPMEISGLCGRLLCCLTYEDDYYREIKGRFPRVGRTVETPYGPGKVIQVCVFTEKVTLLLEDGSKIEMTADQLAGEAPPPPHAEKGVRREALDATLAAQESAAPSTGSLKQAPTGRGGQPQGQGNGGQRDNAQGQKEEQQNQGGDRATARSGKGAPQRSRRRRPRNARQQGSNRSSGSGGMS